MVMKLAVVRRLARALRAPGIVPGDHSRSQSRCPRLSARCILILEPGDADSRTSSPYPQGRPKAGSTEEDGNGGANGGDAPVDSSELDVRKLLRALQAVRDGDFSVRLASDQTGLAGKVADTFNEIVNSNQRLARELERAGQIVGKDGKTRHRMSIDRRSGAWGAMEASVNTLMDDLLWPTTEVTRTISAWPRATCPRP